MHFTIYLVFLYMNTISDLSLGIDVSFDGAKWSQLQKSFSNQDYPTFVSLDNSLTKDYFVQKFYWSQIQGRFLKVYFCDKYEYEQQSLKSENWIIENCQPDQENTTIVSDMDEGSLFFNSAIQNLAKLTQTDKLCIISQNGSAYLQTNLEKDLNKSGYLKKREKIEQNFNVFFERKMTLLQENYFSKKQLQFYLNFLLSIKEDLIKRENRMIYEKQKLKAEIKESIKLISKLNKTIKNKERKKLDIEQDNESLSSLKISQRSLQQKYDQYKEELKLLKNIISIFGNANFNENVKNLEQFQELFESSDSKYIINQILMKYSSEQQNEFNSFLNQFKMNFKTYIQIIKEYQALLSKEQKVLDEFLKVSDDPLSLRLFNRYFHLQSYSIYNKHQYIHRCNISPIGQTIRNIDSLKMEIIQGLKSSYLIIAYQKDSENKSNFKKRELKQFDFFQLMSKMFRFENVLNQINQNQTPNQSLFQLIEQLDDPDTRENIKSEIEEYNNENNIIQEELRQSNDQQDRSLLIQENFINIKISIDIPVKKKRNFLQKIFTKEKQQKLQIKQEMEGNERNKKLESYSQSVKVNSPLNEYDIYLFQCLYKEEFKQNQFSNVFVQYLSQQNCIPLLKPYKITSGELKHDFTIFKFNQLLLNKTDLIVDNKQKRINVMLYQDIQIEINKNIIKPKDFQKSQIYIHNYRQDIQTLTNSQQKSFYKDFEKFIKKQSQGNTKNFFFDLLLKFSSMFIIIQSSWYLKIFSFLPKIAMKLCFKIKLKDFGKMIKINNPKLQENIKVLENLSQSNFFKDDKLNLIALCCFTDNSFLNNILRKSNLQFQNKMNFKSDTINQHQIETISDQLRILSGATPVLILAGLAVSVLLFIFGFLSFGLIWTLFILLLFWLLIIFCIFCDLKYCSNSRILNSEDGCCANDQVFAKWQEYNEGRITFPTLLDQMINQSSKLVKKSSILLHTLVIATSQDKFIIERIIDQYYKGERVNDLQQLRQLINKNSSRNFSDDAVKIKRDDLWNAIFKEDYENIEQEILI